MNDVYEAVLFDELLSPEERQAFHALVASDPALKETVRQWRHVRQEVRRCLDELVPDRELLVHYALYVDGRGEILSEEEKQLLDSARPGIERALRQHPGLADAVRRIQNDASCFDEAWAEHCGKPSKQFHSDRDSLGSRVPAQRIARWPWRIAAGIAMAAFIAVTLFIVQRDAGLEVVRTAPGEMRLIELADGSMVRLMGDSELAHADLEEVAAARRVRLEGRAYFDVKPGGQPFTVETPAAVATVLGTSFGVSAVDQSTEVVLATGHIAVAPRNSPERMVTLQPGEKTRVDEGSLPSTPTLVNVNEELHWTGLLIFNASPLEEIASALASHFEMPISVAEELRNEPVTGTFEQTQGVEEIIEALGATLGASVENRAGVGYYIGSDRQPR